MTLRKIAEDEDVGDRYVGALIHLGCLAPDLVEAILTGRQPRDLELRHMLPDIPLDWSAQSRRFGFER